MENWKGIMQQGSELWIITFYEIHSEPIQLQWSIHLVKAS